MFDGVGEPRISTLLAVGGSGFEILNDCQNRLNLFANFRVKVAPDDDILVDKKTVPQADTEDDGDSERLAKAPVLIR